MPVYVPEIVSAFFNSFLKNPGNYFNNSLQNRFGCDSVVELNLTLETIDTLFIDTTICESNTILFNGNNLSIPGIYFDSSLTAQNGCDSIQQLILKVIPKDTILRNTSICQNDSLLFDSQYLKSAGTYFRSFPTSVGCDSTIQLNLIVNNVNDTVLFDTICKGKSYNFNGLNLDSSGFYQDNLINTFGCDSAVKFKFICKSY